MLPLRCLEVRALSLAFALAVTLPACGEGPRATPEPPPPPPAEAVSVRVATFNVQRLFDTTCDTGQCSPGAFEEQPSQAAFDANVRRLATGIAALEADVVALQEIETKPCLDALHARLPDYTVAIHGETGAPGSVDVAILSKGTLLETRKHASKPIPMRDGRTTTFARELLEVHLAFGDRTVVVFSAHFRSKNNDDPERRIAEAIAARGIVAATAAEKPDALVVLAGDLNDVPGSEPIDALERGDLLVRIARELPPSLQATYVYNGQPEAIDHIFVAAGVSHFYVPGSVLVRKDGGRGYAGSDHGAVQADFRVVPLE